MRITLIINIYDRIVSIRSNTYCVFTRKPGRNKRPGFFMPAVQNKGRYIMKFLFAMMIIRFLFSLLDNVPEENEEVNINENGLVIHPAEYLTR